jgi:hypothetical protein
VTTAVPASSTGMPAAMSAPNTASSRISVSGTDVHSDLRKSLPSSAFATLNVADSCQIGQHGRIGGRMRAGDREGDKGHGAVAGEQTAGASLVGTANVGSRIRPSRERRLDLQRDLAYLRRSVGGQVPFAGAGLDQDVLCRRRHYAELGQDLLAPASLAGIVLLHARTGGELAADERRDHEAKPEGHCRLAVPGAPAGKTLDNGTARAAKRSVSWAWSAGEQAH